MDVPILTTERLTLRGWREDDLAPYAAMTADPEVMRFMGGPRGEDETWREIALYAGHWELRGHGLWAVEREGALIGRVGLWRPRGWPGLEVGWLLARHAWGQGYATEAARASVEYAWRNLDAERLISLIAPDNQASARVAQRLGMEPGGDWAIRGTPVVIHAVARPAAAAPRRSPPRR
jgi:RimJ/RimL family protein N-acetyltransferase